MVKSTSQKIYDQGLIQGDTKIGTMFKITVIKIMYNTEYCMYMDM